MYQHNIVRAGLFALSTLFITSQAFAQAEVIEKRQSLMKTQGAASKAIKGAVEAKDYATVETKAKDLMGTADKIVDHFPKGSTKGKTKALGAIWDKSDDFAKGAKNLRNAASELADAAKSRDEAAVGVKVKGVSNACGGCHKAFRAEKYSE